MIETAPAPLMMYSNYLACVREAIQQQPQDWTFKSDPRYREVLEHTPVEFADAMLWWSMGQIPNLDLARVRQLAELNDSVGKPEQQSIKRLGKFAPSNMRYLCHAIKLWQHIDSLGFPEVDIVEIGGGYGGLTLWVRGLAELYRTRLREYYVVDIAEVAILQNMVSLELGFGLLARNGTNRADLFSTVKRSPVLFSAYAFSEFDQPTRDWYAELVVKNCRHGMMIWNFPQAIDGGDGRMIGGPVYPFVEWPITRVPDEPRLYDGHEMVTW